MKIQLKDLNEFSFAKVAPISSYFLRGVFCRTKSTSPYLTSKLFRNWGNTEDFIADNKSGFTLIETLVGTAVFLMVAIALYQAYGLIFQMLSLTRAKTAAYELAAERVEVIRNMPYAQIGIVNGIPSGTLTRFAEYSRSGFTFQATTTIHNTDDAFDGTITSTPRDSAPADYKLVEFEIGCKTCNKFVPITVTTTAAPRSLESTTGNGALFVKAIDANGIPVSDATVTVVGQGTSTVSISDLTANDGVLQIIDVPPGSFKYAVTLSKAGYSTERTYSLAGVPGSSTSTPVNPHPTVASGQATQLTFAIDKTASLNIHTVNTVCGIVPSIPLTIIGSKKIGVTPNVFKYSSSINTGGTGVSLLSGMEWDSYSITPGSGYVIGGSIPFLPVSIAPQEVKDVYLLARTASTPNLLVRVKDASSGLPISGATVTISKSGYQDTGITSKGFLKQSDWTHGEGQLSMSDAQAFYSSTNINTATSSQLTLLKSGGIYQTPGELVSSWFDIGNGSTTLYALEFTPTVQASSTGANSVRLQLESTQAIGSTTTGFIGPDATPASFYTATSTNVNVAHSNKRYVRYKLFMSTASTTVSSLVSTVTMTYGTECTPFGQAFFENVPTGSYTVSVSRSGYQSASSTVSVQSSGQSTDFSLNSQ